MVWFTKQADGFRGWLPVEQNNGTLRTGLAAGDFVVTIVDPDDDASAVVAASESSEKSGLYFFDITSGFITTNGVGEYGIVVEIDTKTGPSSAPHVVMILDSVLKVSQEDFDSLPTVSATADAVWTEQIGDHSGASGSTAEALNDVSAGASPSAIADAVWDETLSDHVTAGTTGNAQRLIQQMTAGFVTVSTDGATITVFDTNGTTVIATYSVDATQRTQKRLT